MNLEDLIEQLDQRYGNPHAKDCVLIQEAIEVLKLQSAEIQSGFSRQDFAQELIKQLPEDHEGRNTWLLNYGNCK